jgi:hypothetical protein
MSPEAIPYPEIDCEEYKKALKQVSAALKRLSDALQHKKALKQKTKAGKKR